MEKLIRWLAVWIWKRYPYMLQEIVVGHSRHIHKNPRKRLTAVVNFPKEVTDGDESIFSPDSAGRSINT